MNQICKQSFILFLLQFFQNVSILESGDEFMEAFLNATAWMMTQPKPYGLFHIVMLVCGIPLTILLAWKLRNKKEHSYHRILFAAAVMLLIAEVYKQLFHFYIIDNKSYDWWIFPFQLCSLPMYLCLLLPFIKKSRWLIPLETFLMDFNLLGGLMALFVPDGLMHPYITLTMHAFLWHFLLLFIGFFIGFSKHGDTSLSGFLKTLPILFFCIGIATLLNVAFHPYGDINMFYISPYTMTTQPVFSQIMQHTGILFGNLIYIFAMCIAALLIHLLRAMLRQTREK